MDILHDNDKTICTSRYWKFTYFKKKERKQKQILSYIIITSEILIAIFIKNTTISGIIIFGDFIQTLTITRIAYRVTHNKYGHEIYAES